MPQPRKNIKPATYKVLGGKHHVREAGSREIKTYGKGDTIKSFTDLRVSFPNKFELVEGQTPEDILEELATDKEE